MTVGGRSVAAVRQGPGPPVQLLSRRRTMHRRPSSRARATAAVVFTALLMAGCEARGYGAPPSDLQTPQMTVVAPQSNTVPVPDPPPGAPAAAFDGLDARVRQATADAANSGADIRAVVLDRNTG